MILDTFGQYGISVNKTEQGIQHAIEGPASILFRVLPGRGVEPKKLTEKSDALKLALKLHASQEIRFAIDEGYMTIDVPKLDRDRYFVDAADLWSRWKRPEDGLKVPLGEDRFGKVVEIDFTSSNSPHLLIGGTTGSGKSEALNTILAGVTQYYSPRRSDFSLLIRRGRSSSTFRTLSMWTARLAGMKRMRSRSSHVPSTKCRRAIPVSSARKSNHLVTTTPRHQNANGYQGG